jgi:predicted nuclease with TOPRIM domain
MNGSELVNKVRQYEASLADYRDKMMLMSVEIDRLNDALRKLNGEN